jgi:hypothetical protein
MEEEFIMKNLARIALIGLSFVTVASFAAYPPVPAPGVSCKTAYPLSTPPTTQELQNYCGCYQYSSVTQCKLLAQHGYAPSRTCTGSFSTLIVLTCAQEGMRGIKSFCKTNVGNLNRSGDTATTMQDCIDDVGYICDRGGKSICAPYWQ